MSYLLKATGLLAFVQGLGVIASVLRTKATALLIGAAGVGLINYFNQGIALLSSATGFGLSFSGVQRLSRLYERGREAEQQAYVAMLRSWTLVVALLGATVCVIVGPLISFFATRSWAQTPLWFMLSPAIALTAIVGTEGAILKATRQLRLLALTTGLSTLTTLVLSVAVYWAVGIQGVVPVLVGCLAVQSLIMLCATHRRFPLRWAFRHPSFRRTGGHLFRLGVGYVGAGLVGSGAEMLISALLYRTASVEAVGLYAAGFVLTVSYVRLLFAAVEADYFPRLAALVGRGEETLALVNAQIDVLVLLVAPCLVGIALALPWLVPLLYSADFLPVVPMVAIALLSMLFKAIYTPIAYLPLARAESKVYFTMETLYYIVLCLAVTGGYAMGAHLLPASPSGGLAGAGAGIAFANGFDLCAITFYYARRYGFRFAAQTLRHCWIQGVCVAMGLGATFIPDLSLRLGTAGAVLAISSAYSLYRLAKGRR